MENDASGASGVAAGMSTGSQPSMPGQNPAGPTAMHAGGAGETGQKKRLLPADWIVNKQPPRNTAGPVPRPLHPFPNGSNSNSGGGAPRPSVKALRFNGALSYVSDPRQCVAFEGMELLQGMLQAAASQPSPSPSSSKCEGPLVLGFDLEWTTRFVAGQPPGKTAVLQLALGPGHRGGAVFLFHVAHLKPLPPVLVQILCEEGVKKVGVGISNDVCKLAADFATELHENGHTGLKGFQELSELATHALGRPITQSKATGGWAPKWSLADLVTRCLPGYALHKPSHLRTGNWDKRPLHPDQLCYAATDAWACIRVYDSLMSMSSLLPSPPPPLTDINYVHPRYAHPSLPLPLPSSSPSPSPSSLILSQLAPSKREAFVLWSQGLSLVQVASQKGVKVGTVSSYLGEAIGLGGDYDAARLERELEESMGGGGRGHRLVHRATRAFHSLMGGGKGEKEGEGEGEGGGVPRLGDVRREVAAMVALEEREGEAQAAGGGYWEIALLYRHLVRRAKEGQGEGGAQAEGKEEGEGKMQAEGQGKE